MMDVATAIVAELEKLEAARQATVLYAVESGSRAWGFASPDSDYDVRFIYAHTADHYLRLDPQPDVIEWMLGSSDAAGGEILDISGWDLPKFLRLLHASNPVIFEWVQSPIIYHVAPVWEEVREAIPSYFSKKKAVHHYLSMAKGQVKAYLGGETVRLKKYFYMLRPLLAAQWVLHNDSPPPILFADLVAAELPTTVRPAVDQLMSLKMAAPELGTSAPIESINNYIHHTLDDLQDRANAVPPGAPGDWEALNTLFRRVVLATGSQSTDPYPISQIKHISQ